MDTDKHGRTYRLICRDRHIKTDTHRWRQAGTHAQNQKYQRLLSWNGNSYLPLILGDSLSGHNGFGFSTQNVDNDSNPDGSCARYIQGAWWFHACCDSCLTCAYKTPGVKDCRSMYWNSYDYCMSLRTARMMVRPM